MAALRTFLAAAGSVVVLLVVAVPTDAQVMNVNRGFNPWTGQPYRNVTVRNPWTGRVGTVSTVVDPWTGARARSSYRHPPHLWAGPAFVGPGPGVQNPWTGRPRWQAGPRRGWW